MLADKWQDSWVNGGLADDQMRRANAESVL
jgi:hypothetical protein